MTRIDEIEERLLRCAIDRVTFDQNSPSDMRFLLSVIKSASLQRAPFDPKTVYVDKEGHYCVPLVKKPLN